MAPIAQVTDAWSRLGRVARGLILVAATLGAFVTTARYGNTLLNKFGWGNMTSPEDQLRRLNTEMVRIDSTHLVRFGQLEQRQEQIMDSVVYNRQVREAAFAQVNAKLDFLMVPQCLSTPVREQQLRRMVATCRDVLSNP